MLVTSSVFCVCAEVLEILPRAAVILLCGCQRIQSCAGLMNAPAPPTEYTAPEVWKAMQLARTCLTTAAADVWAVGALAFELSTGVWLPPRILVVYAPLG